MAETDTISRLLSACMLGVVANHRGEAVDTTGKVIWEDYGGDGYDSQMLGDERIALLDTMTNEEIKYQYDSHILKRMVDLKGQLNIVYSKYIKKFNGVIQTPFKFIHNITEKMIKA